MPATSPVVWQPVAALETRFAIESAAPAALQRARQLFAPWLVENSAASVACRWRIEADDEGKAQNRWSAVSASANCAATDAPLRERPLMELLTQIEYASLGHLVTDLPNDFVGLHGALLSRQRNGARRAVIVVGPKEAGKSTLACALWAAGWTLHCDDFTLLHAEGCAWPTARRVSLRNGSRSLLGEELWQSALQTPSARPASGGLLFHPHEIRGQARAQREALPVAAICFLQRRTTEIKPAQLAPLNGIEAALALLPYSNLLFEAGKPQILGDWSAHLAQIATLLAGTGIALYDLGRGEPAAMVREIEQLVQDHP